MDWSDNMKLSIIIPVYNVEAYLPKCLDSVIRPELPGYEIIAVNDGSTDNSLKVLESYAVNYPALIRIVSTPNGGLGHARNEGIEAARGEYLMFLDSDDYLSENAVSEMLDTIATGEDMYIFDFRAVNEHGSELIYYTGFEKEGKVTLKTDPELLTAMPNAVNKLCRRELFIDTGIRFPDRVWYEDLRTMPKLYLHTESIVSVHKMWYNYLMRSGSITNSANEKRNLEIIPAVDAITDYYRENGCYEKYSTELEFMAFYNQYLTSSTRVALMNSKSPVLGELRDNYIRKFPDFEKNEKIKAMPKKWVLLSKLIKARRYSAVAAVMKLNNIVRGK